MKYLPSNQCDCISFPAPSRVASYFDAVRLNSSRQRGEVFCDGTLRQRRGYHDAMDSFAFRVDESGENVGL